MTTLTSYSFIYFILFYFNFFYFVSIWQPCNITVIYVAASHKAKLGNCTCRCTFQCFQWEANGSWLFLPIWLATKGSKVSATTSRHAHNPDNCIVGDFFLFANCARPVDKQISKVRKKALRCTWGDLGPRSIITILETTASSSWNWVKVEEI